LSHWPQYTYLAIIMISLGFTIGLHGQQLGRANAWMRASWVVVALFLLWKGGFFNGMPA
jgi:hypothetical protein